MLSSVGAESSATEHPADDRVHDDATGSAPTAATEETRMTNHAKPASDRMPFERFTEAMKRIMTTPKAEVEKRAESERRRRRAARRHKK